MEVRARAPGKIILAGEHAVVHGSTAMAAAIDLYTYVSLGFPTPNGTVHSVLLHFLFFIVVPCNSWFICSKNENELS